MSPVRWLWRVPHRWFIAVACAMINVVGGFIITDRMLKMFKRADKPEGGK